MVALARQEAQLLADASGLSRYDAVVDRYEPGMRSAEIERLFGDVRRWLPNLIANATARQAATPVIPMIGPFPVDKQRALNLEMMALMGFDFTAGRLDESAHPFSGGVPEDVRLTTRYREDDFVGTQRRAVAQLHARDAGAVGRR